MNQKVESMLHLFTQNHQNIRNEFIWQEPMAKRLAALAYAMEGQPLNAEAIKEHHQMIKSEVGAFSSFRGMLSVYVAAALSLNPEPGQLLENTLYVYELLREQGFWRNDYLVISAFEIAENAKKIDYEHTAARAMAFYDEMKANHRFQISSDDYIFAAMLALTDMDVHQGANKVKAIYIRLREEFSRFTSKNSLLTLAQMLALGGSTEYCAENVAKLNRALRIRKIKLDKTYTLPSLGVLSLLNQDPCDLANELNAVTDYLRAQKGFGALSVSVQELQLYAVSLMTHAHIGDEQAGVTKAGVTTSVTNLLIAQQVALIASMAAMSAAAAASC
ncbi:MAG: DUF4003 domain-containing protein [Defluviitaleaceae bacterium]|nr:DUF4003 domain-containing protein [Defluviitaleaceae bacterium]